VSASERMELDLEVLRDVGLDAGRFLFASMACVVFAGIDSSAACSLCESTSRRSDGVSSEAADGRLLPVVMPVPDWLLDDEVVALADMGVRCRDALTDVPRSVWAPSDGLHKGGRGGRAFICSALTPSGLVAGAFIVALGARCRGAVIVVTYCDSIEMIMLSDGYVPVAIFEWRVVGHVLMLWLLPTDVGCCKVKEISNDPLRGNDSLESEKMDGNFSLWGGNKGRREVVHHVSMPQLPLREVESICVFAPGTSPLQHVKMLGERREEEEGSRLWESKEDPREVFFRNHR
jgi:hypothetical protein